MTRAIDPPKRKRTQEEINERRRAIQEIQRTYYERHRKERIKATRERTLAKRRALGIAAPSG